MYGVRTEWVVNNVTRRLKEIGLNISGEGPLVPVDIGFFSLGILPTEVSR